MASLGIYGQRNRGGPGSLNTNSQVHSSPATTPESTLATKLDSLPSMVSLREQQRRSEEKIEEMSNTVIEL